MRKTILLLLAACLLGYNTFAGNNYSAKNRMEQTASKKIVSGVIIDETGKPIVGAVVSVPETDFSISTNRQGKFAVPLTGDVAELLVEFTGYKTKLLSVKSGDDVTISLIPDAHRQDEYIPVSMLRKERRKSITGAFSIVEGSELEKYPSGGFAGSLTGKLAGLTILQGSGEPGYDGVGMFIRGRNSTSGNHPIFVIDGVPSPTFDLNMLDPKTVESIAILKDAAATALYGFNGSAGAILITTKRGYNGESQVSVSADFSLQEATVRPKMLHSWEYAMLRNEAASNDDMDMPFSEKKINAYRTGENRELFPDNNWYDAYMKDIAPMQRYNVNISGGNGRVKYFVNTGFIEQDALLKVQEKEVCDPSKYMQRFNERTNIDIKLLSNLRAFLNQMVVVKRINSPAYSTSDILSGIFSMPATEYGPLTPDGNVIATPWDTNPIYGKINRSGSQKYTETTVNVALGLDWDIGFITKGLNMKGIFGYESRHQSGIFGSRSYARYVKDDSSYDELAFKPFGSWIDSELKLNKGSNYRYFINFQGFINYKRTFNKVHEVNAFVSYFNQDVIQEGAGSQLLPYDQISFNGHAKYGFNSKYYIQMDASFMTSDQFGGENRYGLFPTISGAWIASNENFLKSNTDSWLTLLKFKASYGKVGNDQFTDRRYMYEDDIRLGSGGYISGLYSGAIIYESLLGNPYLKWEDSRQQNYGVSIGLFNSLTMNFDYYIHNQSDVLIKNSQIPGLQGLPLDYYPYENSGKVKNHGFEIELAYEKQIDNEWHISASGNIAYNKNEIVDINEVNRASSNFFYPYRSTGYSIGQNFGLLVDYSNGNGYFNSEQEIIDSNLHYEGIAPRPGDFIYKDLNEDGVINNQDNAPIKYNTLPQLAYAANLNLAYKVVDLFVQFQGISKVSGYYSGIGVNEIYSEGTYSELHKNAWSAERFQNGEKISYPALSTSASSSIQANSFFIGDKSYLRLKNIEIGCNLPSRLCNKISTEKIRFYLSGTNLLTFDNMQFKDLDPETSSLSSYPQYRTYNLGLNIIF
ncbi:SusC/RagA family TonB-linked outer membrane protein [Mariniphaga anaerophila]|uniref:SusC/RagA family TonB-linked outer membrane protein n=1 Tax=Mariniphaga anaerophila TaxID=1484053 RepID=UPI00158791A9|nr:SusC/RagA family TonB-linked outer membrane protein [Mariniphaga anaerophila]